MLRDVASGVPAGRHGEVEVHDRQGVRSVRGALEAPSVRRDHAGGRLRVAEGAGGGSPIRQVPGGNRYEPDPTTVGVGVGWGARMGWIRSR